MAGGAHEFHRCRRTSYHRAAEKTKTPVILVINKTDTVKKDDILAFIDTYRKELDFCEIVPVSALKGDNTDVLIQCI